MALEQAWIFLKSQVIDDWCDDCAGSGISTETNPPTEWNMVQIPKERLLEYTGNYYCKGPDNEGCSHGERLMVEHRQDPSTWQPGRDINAEVERILEEQRRRRGGEEE
tara:strand:+ start:218 stop:541 length:324 start_codon:yes stop_codon:yes gene_type:complete